MKNFQQLIQECTSLFLQTHNELNVTTSNTMLEMNIQEKKIYAGLGIQFAIKFMQEQAALEKGK